ncbi:MAG: hypothetical protein IIX69_05620, partial [Clostridia bacterium]|nr:hypothetical protein [Clostridia bacterium]
ILTGEARSPIDPPNTADPAKTDAPATDVPTVTDAAVNEGTFKAGVYTATSSYAAEYEKVSAMAGTVLYKYTATVGADGAFSYSVKFAMGGQDMDGASAKGTYKVEGDKFIFTAEDGTVTEGKVTAENTFVISLKASAMAADPYEVTFTVVK